jgi:hypothetical protein
MAAGWPEAPVAELLFGAPVCVFVACVVDHRLHLSHQLNVCVSVVLVVGAPGAGGVERHPGLRALRSLVGRDP